MVATSPPRTLVGALAAAVACALALGALLGCGGEEPDEELLETLSYLDVDAALVVVASTDLEDAELVKLDELGSRLAGWDGLLSTLQDVMTVGGGTFEGDVESQLGGPLVFSPGITSSGMRAALWLQSPEALRISVEQAVQDGEVEQLPSYEGAIVWQHGGPLLAFGAVHESTLVVAESEEQVRAAIESSADPDNLSTNDALVSRLEQPGEDPPVRFAVDTQRALRTVPWGERARELTWIRALDLAGGSITVEGREVVATIEVDTDRREVAPGDLPLAEGATSPRLPEPNAGAVAGLRGPARTAGFALQVLEALGHDAEGSVLEAVERVRASLDLDPVGDILGRIDELWVALAPEGGVAFRARLDDPDGLDADLRRAPLFMTILLEGFGVQDTTLEITDDAFTVMRGAQQLAQFEIDGDELRGALESLPREGFQDTAPGAAQGSFVAHADPGPFGALVPAGRLGTRIARLTEQTGPLTLEVEARPKRTRARITLALDR